MYILIDIGGTNLRIAVSESLKSKNIKIIYHEKMSGRYSEDIKNIINTVRKTNDSIKGIGISFAGVLEETKKSIRNAANLIDFVNKPLVYDLEKEFGCNVKMENDVVCSGYGEACFSDLKEKEFLFISWGTGVGSSYVKNEGKNIEVNGFEAGHLSLDWYGSKCPCGQTGCAELYIGGKAIEKKYLKPAESLNDKEWEEVLNYFAQMVLNILMIRPVKTIILSGSVALNQKDKIIRIEEILREKLTVYSCPNLIISKLGGDVTLLGALTLL